MATIIQWRRDTAANWTATDPVLSSGEAGYETDTEKLKLGDGVTVWTLLPYWSGGVSGGIVESVVGGTDITVNSVDPANPVVNFSGTIPPPGGQVDTVVGGTDITVDATDPANPIVNYTGSGGGGTQENPPFAYKPAGEPIVLVLTGQSNAVGATTAPPQPFPPNARVFDWTTGGSGSVYTFQSPDLNAPQRADFNDLLVYTGMPLGGRGNIGWSAANRIQELTGRDVYVICVALNSEPIQGWYAGQQMANELNIQVPAALAAVPSGPAGIDGFLWAQGDANLEIVSPANYLPPKEYAQAFLTEVYDQFVTEGWIIDRQTQVAVTEFSPAWGTLATMFWEIQYAANEFFRVISSYQLPLVGDNIHFTPYALAQLGDVSANGFMAGPDPKLKNPEAYLEDLWNLDIPNPEQNQTLYYDAATLKWKAKTSTSALGIIEFDYRWSTAPNATPIAGRVSSNNADPALATIIYINEESQPGNDLSLFFDSLEAGDWLNINAPGAFETRNAYDVTGPAVKTGLVYAVPVSLFNSTPYLPGNNNQIALFLRFTNVDDGLPPGGLDGQIIYKVGTDDYVSTWGDAPVPGGQVNTVVGGTDITVDATDPINPVVNFTGSAGGGFWEPDTDPNDIVNTNTGNVKVVNTFTANVLGADTDCYVEGQYFVTGSTPLLSGANKFEVVAALPGVPDPNTIYFVTA